MYREIIEEFTSPEDAYLYNRWAPITPMIIFGILYFLAREVKIEINMFFLLLIYATASYSAWTWGKTIKTQKEIIGKDKDKDKDKGKGKGKIQRVEKRPEERYNLEEENNRKLHTTATIKGG